ncbi:MAG: hypothetical protein Q7S21_03010 [archaeon]|nr:hypothetical protein [archaeon]
MQLFKTGKNLRKQFPESLLIEYSELDSRSKGIINAIKKQMWFSFGGIVGYPSIAKLAKLKGAFSAVAICLSIHIFLTKHCQELLLKRLEKEQIASGISFAEIKRKYSHLIVDLNGNVLLVRESKKGFLKRYLSNFYLVRTRIKKPKLKKSRAFNLMRKAQRKFWPKIK